MEFLFSVEMWVSLLTLSILEIVLGIDNIIFISIISEKLPERQQAAARRLGLLMALAGRIAFLFSMSWIIRLTEPILTINSFALSWRDLILGLGGLFLLYKGTMEIHSMLEDKEEDLNVKGRMSFGMVVFQIGMLDVVFALDSMITAVGLASELWIMIAANVIAMIVMMFSAAPIGKFIHKHPTVKMLALSFLLLVGVALVADGMHFHIPRNYIYFAIAFSMATETLNILHRRTETKRNNRKKA